MKLEARLRRLEKSAPPPCPACRDRHGHSVVVTYHEGVAEGRCPVCGFRPDDIRTLVFGCYREADSPGECSQGREAAPGGEEEGPDQPGLARCPRCGGYMPPIAIVEDFDPEDVLDTEDEPAVADE